MQKYEGKMEYDSNQFDQDYNSEPFDNFFENAINNSIERVDRLLDIFEEAGMPDMLTLCSNCHCRTFKKYKNKPNLCHVCEVMMKYETAHKHSFRDKLKDFFLRVIK